MNDWVTIEVNSGWLSTNRIRIASTALGRVHQHSASSQRTRRAG